MPVLQFKGKTAVECYHHTIAHHKLEFDAKLSVLGNDMVLDSFAGSGTTAHALLEQNASDSAKRKFMKERVPGLGGSFTYARVGAPLFGALDLAWLQTTTKTDKNRQLVVYCEKIWIYRDDLARFEQESSRKVRPMLVPINLK